MRTAGGQPDVRGDPCGRPATRGSDLCLQHVASEALHRDSLWKASRDCATLLNAQSQIEREAVWLLREASFPAEALRAVHARLAGHLALTAQRRAEAIAGMPPWPWRR